MTIFIRHVNIINIRLTSWPCHWLNSRWYILIFKDNYNNKHFIIFLIIFCSSIYWTNNWSIDMDVQNNSWWNLQLVFIFIWKNLCWLLIWPDTAHGIDCRQKITSIPGCVWYIFPAILCYFISDFTLSERKWFKISHLMNW